MKIGKDYIWVGCWALIINEKNQVLLMKRTWKSQWWGGGYWSRPGWAVDFGETFEQAVIREIKEEINVDVKLFWPQYLYNDIRNENWQKLHWVACWWFAKIINWTPENLEPEKCEKIEWFDLDKIPENTIQYTKTSIQEYIDYLNSQK